MERSTSISQHIYMSGCVSLIGANAVNEDFFTDCATLPKTLADLARFAQTCAQALDAPSDLPCAARALDGMALAVTALADRHAVPRLLTEKIREARALIERKESPGAALVAFSRRKATCLLYALAIEVADRVTLNKSVDQTVLSTLGSWLVRRLIDKWMPSSTAIATIRSALIRPDGSQAIGWQVRARERAFNRAVRGLQKSISDNLDSARALGLAIQIVRTERPTDPMSIFNRAFRRRINNLNDYSTRNAITAAGGYGTLSKNSLYCAGSELLDRVNAGDLLGVLISLEIVSHLPAATVLMVPLQVGDIPIENALAWFDFRRGTFNYRLFHLDERGARPAKGCESCYEKTSQVVTIFLPPFLISILLARMEQMGGRGSTLGDLLGSVMHQPRSSINGSAGYRTTVRRLQESLPALLIQQGHHRWPVALATNSQFLVSRGRPAYSACRASRVAETVNASYRLLGWPVVPEDNSEVLIGSFVTPRTESIVDVLNSLAGRADRIADPLVQPRESLICILNAHAAWTSCLLAFGLALRKSVCYALSQAEMRSGGAVHVDDKRVHKVGGPPVPIPDLLHRIVLNWFSLCHRVASQLCELGDPVSVDLALHVERQLSNDQSFEPIFTVSAAGKLVGTGSETWHAMLPVNLKLQANFGRHFWPFKLMDEGIEQLATDTLMRHQLDGMRPTSSHSTKSRESTERRLRSAMNVILESMAIRVPRELQHA